MRNTLNFLIIALISTGMMLSSCIVSKKKYDTAVYNGKKSLDSLNQVFNKTVAGFNTATNALKSGNAAKDISIDSLNRENLKLSGDKEALNQSLINSINDYKEEKEKLSQKSRMADSLMNILVVQTALEDSAKTVSDSRKKELEAITSTFNKQFQGNNQSDVYAQVTGSNITITLSNDFLFKAQTTELSVKGSAILKKAAAVLDGYPNSRINVISNTDNNGQAKTLLELSVKRSAAVVSFFAANCTLACTAYTASGRGMYSPLASNANSDDKKKNRRTEIIIMVN